jgi:hypothetical protein
MTEDDTYIALKRISIVELERRMGSLVPTIREQMREIRFNFLADKDKFIQPSLMDLSTTLHVSILINGVEWEEVFKGSGWTSNDYVKELFKIFDKEWEEIKEKKRISKRNQWIGALTSGAVCALISTVWPFTPFWVGSLIGMPVGVAVGIFINKKWLPF